jgi:hypothetical protein
MGNSTSSHLINAKATQSIFQGQNVRKGHGAGEEQKFRSAAPERLFRSRNQGVLAWM